MELGVTNSEAIKKSVSPSLSSASKTRINFPDLRSFKACLIVSILSPARGNTPLKK
jgi:hypothetical protein